jgi:hypothetical protein
MTEVTDPTIPAGPGAPGGAEVAEPIGPFVPGADRHPQPQTLLRRIVRRVFRRQRAWIDAPWTIERSLKFATTALFLTVTTGITLRVVHIDLVLKDNTPTGGDMGAHVMGPAYLRDHLLNNFRISGWTPYWYDGFPLYRFYMVIPALAIVLLNVVLPYGIAFKIIAIAGIVTLPLCAWAFGRLARFPFPIPELFSLGALIFLLDESFSIYGGNVKSTMAGEFSFSIALSLAVLGLGLFARGLETGQHRAKTAVVLALAALCHGIVAVVFVGVGVIVMTVVWADRKRLLYAATTLLPMGLLTAFWMLPFLGGHAYMTDMKYGKRPSGPDDSYWVMFFNLDVTLDRIIFVLALIGFVAAIVKLHMTGIWMGVTILVLCLFTRWAENSLPVIGLLWNPRVLPFIYLLRYMLMMVGLAVVIRGVVWLVTSARLALAVSRERAEGRTGALVPLPTARSRVTGATVGAALTLVTVLLMFAVEYRVPFFGSSYVKDSSGNATRYALGPSWLPLYVNRSTNTEGLADLWSSYNFKGYEGRTHYAEYKQLIDDMAAIGKDPELGCGRALWENNNGSAPYGTTMALMLLPHWTDGCIASSEGLFFEASGTTPYHFLAAAAMSSRSSNPVRQLRYTDNDPEVGIEYLRALGIRYYMAWTDLAVAKADETPGLLPITTSGPWHIYQVTDSDVVVPLTMQPVVVNSRPGDQRERWLEVGTSWFQNQQDWTAMPVADGPSSWQRVDVVVDESRVQNDRVDVVEPAQEVQAVPLDPVVVSNVQMGNESVSFDVDKPGVPVLVKVSYFPNWKTHGATGPYRVAPNLMVVVPTSNHVELTYGRTALDYIAYLVTILGAVLLFVFHRYVPIRFASPNPFRRQPRRAADDTPVQLGPVLGGVPASAVATAPAPRSPWEPPNSLDDLNGSG